MYVPDWKTIFWTEFWQVLTEIINLLIFSRIQFSFFCSLLKLKQLVLESKVNTIRSCTQMAISSHTNITGTLTSRSAYIVYPEENTHH
jgi:hypothetical protein